MTKELLDLQRNFVSHLKNKNDKNILKQIKSSSDIEKLARLNIYRNNVFGGFESALSDIYEITKKKLGSEQFDKFACEYILKYPSKSGNLNDYGKYFPELIKKKLKKHKINYLYELSNLEALLYSTHFLDDEKRKFDLIKFKKISPEKFQNLKFNLNLTVSLIKPKYPIYSIFKGKKVIKKQEYLMVERTSGIAEISELSKEEFLFLNLLKKGKNLYQIFEIIAKECQKFDIGTTLNKFISNAVIVDFRV